MVITPLWNVGIGTESPTARFHVVGNGKFTNSVQVGSWETSRCSSTDDVGKIIYKTQCVSACTKGAALLWCIQNGSLATNVLPTQIITTTRSDNSCPWTCNQL